MIGAGPPTDATPTAPRSARYASDYTDLARLVRASGLMRRRYGYYWSLGSCIVGAIAAVWAITVLLGNSWLQLLCAAALGILGAQVGFLSHDAAHRQIFASPAWNEWASRILSAVFLGLSHSWWQTKHSRHHATPNQSGRDPDIAPGVLIFDPDLTGSRSTWRAAVTRRQGWLLLPLLTLEALNLQVSSMRTLTGRTKLRRRWADLALITTGWTIHIGIVLTLMPPTKGVAFLAVESLALGVCLGGAFVPNHIGMPIVEHDTRLDFLRRQVLMSRNISGRWPLRLAMGGLDCQIEHHLFPSMARPNLQRLRPLVRDYCYQRDVIYTETRLIPGLHAAIRHLNLVGLAHRTTYTCPLATQLR